jgi:aryl-alcohol dehydrogenase-like predicted oxidoreductase
MRALDDMVQAGKVLYLGISDTPAWVVAYANAIAEQRGWTGLQQPPRQRGEAGLRWGG